MISGWSGVTLRKLKFAVSPTTIAYAHLGSVSLFLICFTITGGIFISFLQLISGLCAFVLFPGAILAASIYKDNIVDGGFTFVMGTVFAVVSIQIMLTITLLSGNTFSLPSWLSITALFVVLSGAGYLKRTGYDSLRMEISREGNKALYSILGLAFVVRIILFFSTEGILSPDACLYADFARSIIGGNFQSSISNDQAVIDIWNGIQYIRHIGISFLFALSWMFVIPGGYGPTIILVFSGTLLVLSIHRLTKHFYGSKAAIWVALIAAIHPLFVFHSAAGYGPEITSLLLITYSILLLIEKRNVKRTIVLAAGLMLGIASEIWYPNFYVGCLCLFVIMLLHHNRTEDAYPVRYVGFLLLPLGQMFFNSIIAFATIIAVTVILALEPWNMRMERKNEPLVWCYIGVFAIIFLWRWPFLFGGVTGNYQSADLRQFELLRAIASFPFDKIANFLFFIGFHLTIGLVVVFALSLLNRYRKTNTRGVLVVAMVTSIGTLQVFGLMPQSLQYIYIYSDSRFFLSIVAFCLIISGSFLQRFRWTYSPIHPFGGWLAQNKKPLLVLSVVIIGFIPSYLAIPSGLALIDLEERYGWQGLASQVANLGDEETIFLANRAREFSWISGRKSAVLAFSQSSLDYLNASNEIMMLAANFNTDYILIDGYTLSKWNTTHFLLNDPFRLGNVVVLDVSEALKSRNLNDTEDIHSLELVAETQLNSIGRKSRVYHLVEMNFTRMYSSNLLEPDWVTTNNGLLNNVAGSAIVSIGMGRNSTEVFWSGTSDLGIPKAAGYMIIEANEIDAQIESIGLWDRNNQLIRSFQRVTNTLFFTQIGNLRIDNLRIEIRGEEGASVRIDSLGFWTSL